MIEQKIYVEEVTHMQKVETDAKIQHIQGDNGMTTTIHPSKINHSFNHV